MVITMKCIDVTIYVGTVFESLKDMQKSNRIRTSGQTDNNNATVKEPLSFGKFEDSV